MGVSRFTLAGACALCLGQGLAQEAQPTATIYRDGFGVPHIVADSLEDAAYGDGFAQAQDRLELVLDNIQTANGTRAAVLGDAHLRSDLAARLTGAHHQAYRHWEKVAPRMRKILTAFAGGLNRYQETHPDQLPPNAQRVEPQEVLAYLRYMILARQFAQARQDGTGAGEVPLSGEGALGDVIGSNGWVLAPSRTTSGNPIVVCDPHTPWSGMNRWYEKHYITPEANIYGAGSTGMPLFVFASSENVAWTMTRNSGDRGDCFVVALDPEDSRRYILDGRPREFAQREETIAIRNGPAVKRTVYETVHGPVFDRKEGRAYAAGMSLYHATPATSALLQLATARSVYGLRDALALCELDGSQCFAADRRGNILYGWVNRIPVRSDNYNWLRAVDGSTSGSLYKGILPFNKMPQSANDSGGYYQGSNAANWTLESGAWGMKPADFPAWLRGFIRVPRYFPSRPQRVVDLIASRPKHSIVQARAMALDTRVLAAEWALPVIEKAYSRMAGETRPELDQAMQILRDWIEMGPYATATSRGYTLYRELCTHLSKGNFNDLRSLFPWPETDNLPAAALRPVTAALSKAVENMLKLYGSVSVEWGQINAIELSDGRLFSCGVGDATTQTVWQGTQVRRDAQGKWRVGAGSDFMMVTELSSPPLIYTLVPYGQSDNPKSPHFADQTPRWLEGQWKKAAFTLEDVKSNAKARLKVP